MFSPQQFSSLEALLFLSGEPMSKARLGKLLTLSKKDVDALLSEYANLLEGRDTSGLMLIQNESSVELATKKEHAPLLESLVQGTLQETLSKAALEVLSIVCYRAPIARSHIDVLRGVNCSFTLRNLLLRGLIERRENPLDAREYIYAPTIAFLERLGVGRVEELPDFAILSNDARALHVTVKTEDSLETTPV